MPLEPQAMTGGGLAMAYLRNFTHDVFVSYAHGPRRLDGYKGKRDDFLSDWTKAFVDDLASQLDILLGTKDDARRAAIWMDPALAGNEPLTTGLKTAVESSALLLVVMSEFYLGSTWCGQELDWFRQKAPGVLDRFFVVRAFNADERRWPVALKPDGNALPGYPFHSSSDTDGTPLGWPQPDKNDKSYWEQLTRLAHEIAAQLKK